MSLDLGGVNMLLVVLLWSGLGFNLWQSKRRLGAAALRFYGVAVANVVAGLVLSAWLLNLAVETFQSQTLRLDSDKISAQGTDAAQILLQNPDLTHLSVTGFGLQAQQWRDFAGIEIDYQPPVVSDGFISLAWSRQLLLGQPLGVSGVYHHPAAANRVFNLKLLDLTGQAVAQTRIKPNEPFVLTTMAKAAGRLQYQLVLSDDEHQELAQQRLMSSVSDEAPRAAMMMVQSAPGFESRQLKNWAAAQGASMLLLTKISKDRYLTQALNLPEQVPREFSSASLAAFDLLIIDGRALVQLSLVQQQWLDDAVQQGLGVLVVADQTLTEQAVLPSLLGDFSLQPHTSTNARRAERGVIPNWPDISDELALDALPYQISAQRGQLLLGDSTKAALSVYQRQGLGKVALSILHGRYQWHLNGDKASYGQYWQRLLQQLARVASHSRILPPAPDTLDMKDQQMEICVLSEHGKPLLDVQSGQTTTSVVLAQDRYQQSRYCGVYWPAHAGWHQLLLRDQQDPPLKQIKPLERVTRYVYEHSDWLSWQQQRRVSATLDFKGSNQTQPVSGSYQPFSDSLYWWLWLICVTFLWIESIGADRGIRRIANPPPAGLFGRLK